MNSQAVTVWIMNNAPFYYVRRNSFFVDLVGRLKVFLEKQRAKKYLSGIDLVVVHDLEREKMIREFGKPVTLLRIPVDFKSFYQPAKRISLRKGQAVLLGIGSLSPNRKFEDIIVAGGLLLKKGYDTKVVLVCKDFWKDDSYKQRLFEVTRRSGMSERVIFHFEGVVEKELREIQRQATIFVFPNHINIWSMASFEAMAAGLPLVVSRATSLAEVLRDREHALFFGAGDTAELALRIQELIKSPQLYHRIAGNGQKFVKEHLNWDRYGDELMDVVQKFSH